MSVTFIEHRRHSMRSKPGQHLSQAGVDLARRVGEGMTAFDRVYTSTVPRAFETGIAMGFAVDRQIDLLSSMPQDVEIFSTWDLADSLPSFANIRKRRRQLRQRTGRFSRQCRPVASGRRQGVDLISWRIHRSQCGRLRARCGPRIVGAFL